MEKISKEHIDQLSEDLVSKLITLGSAELTLTQEVEPEWQGAAADLLSTLGLRHAQQVMKELLTKFQPGGSPHFFVVKTLGQLATSNGNALSLSCSVISSHNSHNYIVGMYEYCVHCLFSAGEVVPLLNTVLGRMIPMLGATKQDNMQWVFAYGEQTIIWWMTTR